MRPVARPDLVVLCDGEQVLVVEVQRRRDPARTYAWPLYAALAHRRFGLPARVVVVRRMPRDEAASSRPLP